MATIAQNVIASCPVLVPPISEQEVLLHRIDTHWNRINHTIDSTRRQIDLLQELRTSLIADVVTGKLDVREAAMCLPGEAGELGRSARR